MSSASRPSSSMQGIEKARVAVRMLRRIEDHRHVGRAISPIEVTGQLPQHGRVAVDSSGRLAVAVRQRGQAVIGAEDVARSVDEIEVGLGVRHERGGLAGSRREGSQRGTSLHLA